MSQTPRYKSLLDELDRMVPEKDKHTIVEARAHHFILSGVNLLRLIEENFTPPETEELTRRLFNSLKNRDFGKFQRKIRQLKEGTNNATI